ncbi:DUF7537 family lipoprotein [Halosimplex halobium]|uniref:DUF7537 family lipoprotein n=1 Tax=Halosimplex halobium TaxID=3396618 RepID=UPI003F54B8D0
MGLTVQRTAVLALVGALAVTAGCSGVMDGTTATPEVTDTAAWTPTESAASSTATGATGTARTATARATATAPSFLDQHIARLRAAGNVTVRTTTEQTVSNGDQSVTQTQSRDVQIDFESGRVLSKFEPLAGDGRERYRNASGATFTRLGGDSFLGPERSEELGTETYAGIVAGDADALERNGTGRVDGVSGTVYTVDSIAAAGEGYSNLDPENVTAFEVTYVVDDEGYVSYQRVNVTFAAEGRTVTYSSRRRFVDVGATTVPRPDWVSEARAVAARPDPDDVVTRTYETTGEDGRVELDVTATAGELDDTAALGPEVSENPLFRNDLLNRYRAGEIAQYYFLLDTVESVTIRVHYDDAAVDDANESKLRLVTRNVTTRELVPVNSTVDTASDTVSVTFTSEAALDRHQGKTFLAVRWSQYRSAVAELLGESDDGDGSRTAPRVGTD